MGNKNEHPGTFKDSPEERILYVTVKIEDESYEGEGVDHKGMLDLAIHQSMLETGYDTETDSVSSHIDPEIATYEAKIVAHGSESYFHALGRACMKKVNLVVPIGANQLNVGWRINSPKSMQHPVAFE